MKKRRSNGEGTLFQDKDKNWIARIQTGKDSNGKPKYKQFKSKKQSVVKEKMKNFKLLLEQNINYTEKYYLEDYMLNWFKNTKLISLKPITADNLEATINARIIPRLGHYEVSKITSEIIQTEFVNDLKKQNYSYGTIKLSFACLKQFFKYAMNNKIINFNPCDNVVLPNSKDFQQKKIKFLSDEEIETVIKTATKKNKKGNPIYYYGQMIVFDIYTGLRVGEVCALKWGDIDFKNKTAFIHSNIIQVKNRDSDKISKSVKKLVHQNSAKSTNRIIPLNKKALNALEEMKKISDYSNPNAYIITKNGEMIIPDSVTRTVKTILKKSGINIEKGDGAHVLRHTFASLLIRKNVDIKIVSELLGHSNVAFTYNTYVHILDEQKIKAINMLDDL